MGVGNTAGGWGNMAGVCENMAAGCGEYGRWMWETWQVCVGNMAGVCKKHGMWVWGMAGGSVGVWMACGCGAWPEVLWGYGLHVGLGHGRRFCGGMARVSVGVWQVGVGHGRKFCGGMACGCGAWLEVLCGMACGCGAWPEVLWGHGRWLYRGSVSQYVFSSQCCHHYHCSFCVCLQVAFEIIGVISVLTNCALIGMDPEVQKLLPSDVTAVNMVIIFVAVEV